MELHFIVHETIITTKVCDRIYKKCVAACLDHYPYLLYLNIWEIFGVIMRDLRRGGARPRQM